MTTPPDALAAAGLAAFARRRAAPPIVFGFDISRDRQHAAVIALTRIGDTTRLHLIGQTMPDTSADPTPSFRELVEAALPPHAHIDKPVRGNWFATWTTRKGVYNLDHGPQRPDRTTRITGPDATVLLHKPTADTVIMHLLHIGAIELPDDPEEHATDLEHVWLGDLAGFTIGADGDRAYLQHRCGYRRMLNRDDFLANVISVPARAHRTTGCHGEPDDATAGTAPAPTFNTAEKVRQRVVLGTDGEIQFLPPEPLEATHAELTATDPPSTAVMVGGMVVALEPAHPVMTRIDRIVSVQDRSSYRAIRGTCAMDPKLATPPQIISPAYTHVGLVMVLPSMGIVTNRQITTATTWPSMEEPEATEPPDEAVPSSIAERERRRQELPGLIETWVSRYRTGTYPIDTETAVNDCRNMLVYLQNHMEELAAANAQLAARDEILIGLGATLAGPDRFLGHDNPRPYMLDYRDFWADLIEPEGVLNRDQLARELSDYRTMMVEVSAVYAQLTGGVLSKPHYRGDEVVAAAEQHFAAVYARLLCERAQHCQDNDAFMGANVLRKLANEWQFGAWDKFRQSREVAAPLPLATGGVVHGPVIIEMNAGLNPTPALREAIENFAERRLRHGGQ